MLQKLGEEVQKAYSDSKFVASNAKAEADSAHEVNRALRRRIDVLTSDVGDMRAQLSTAANKDRGLLPTEHSERLQNALLVEQAKVRELEQALDQIKVSRFRACAPPSSAFNVV